MKEEYSPTGIICLLILAYWSSPSEAKENLLLYYVSGLL